MEFARSGFLPPAKMCTSRLHPMSSGSAASTPAALFRDEALEDECSVYPQRKIPIHSVFQSPSHFIPQIYSKKTPSRFPFCSSVFPVYCVHTASRNRSMPIHYSDDRTSMLSVPLINSECGMSCISRKWRSSGITLVINWDCTESLLVVGAEGG